MKKRWTLYLTIFLLLLSLTFAQKVMELKIDFYQNGNVFLKGFKLVDGTPTQEKGAIGSVYNLQVFDEKGRPAYEQTIKPIYFPGSSMTSLFITVPYQEFYDTLVIKQGSQIHIRKSIHTLFCNLNQVCDGFETDQTCVEDCAPETLIACKSSRDGTCDSSCNTDPDCRTSNFPWIYLVLIVIVISVCLIGYEEYKHIQNKHALLKQLNLPSQPAIGVAPPKVASPPLPSNPSEQPSKPS